MAHASDGDRRTMISGKGTGVLGVSVIITGWQHAGCLLEVLTGILCSDACWMVVARDGAMLVCSLMSIVLFGLVVVVVMTVCLVKNSMSVVQWWVVGAAQRTRLY
jgi:hypothetical protein